MRLRQAAPIGQAFGRYTVLGPSVHRRRWRCRCECGTERDVDLQALKRGLTRSCGCLRREQSPLNHPATIPLGPGDLYGRLTVLERAVKRHYWICRCACGTTTTVWKYSLTTGSTTSCGCYSRERATTHGMSRRPENVAWRSMIQRCHNPRSGGFAQYGGRGITVCDEWRDFARFFADVGPRPSRRHSLDRIDNARGYEPGNVAWATPTEQSRNTRRNRWITINGVRRTFTDWCRRTGIGAPTAYRRLKRGWPVERAVSEPSHHA